jgi:N-acetylmuramoyl-L-alanine amidase-like protein
MARILGLILLGALLAGCQQANSESQLPEVMFDGPQVRATTRPDANSAVLASAQQKPAATPQILTANPAPQALKIVPADGSVPADWIPRATPRDWQWIVIHHSATSYGSAAIIDTWHRQRGFDCLGYHWVIDNGNGNPDGMIEVGPRWPIQKWGAHTRTADNRFNDFGIGICLVGNFDVDHPTPAQIKSLVRLVTYLMRTYHIPLNHVIGHSDAKPTDCPGKYLSVAHIRDLVQQELADEGLPPADKNLAAGDEMIHQLAPN